jgi:hypothetical protein
LTNVLSVDPAAAAKKRFEAEVAAALRRSREE